MTYRKFKADHLFTGREMADSNTVLITTEDGMIQDILPAQEAGEGIEYHRGILSPGFINCHCHLELSHLKGMLPERTGLVDFLLAVMQQRYSAPAGSSPARAANQAETAGFIQAAMADAEESMWLKGIVAVGDICNTTHSLAQKKKGRLYYHNFIETMGFIAHSAPHRFEDSRKVFEAFVQAYGSGIPTISSQDQETTRTPNSLAPHAPYSVSPSLFQLIADFPDNRLLTIHNQETEAENEFYRTGQGNFLRLYQAMGLDISFFAGTGKRSLESYLPYFRQTGHGLEDRSTNPGTGDRGHDHHGRQSLLLVHNVATKEEDLQFALQDPSDGPLLFFCLCPNANLYISGELPDVALLVRKGCTIVIGTDSLASNHQLSILEELKTLQQQWPQLSTSTLLTWATSNGAAALQMEGRLGSFHAGKQPGIVLIEGLSAEKFTADATARRLL